MEELSIFRIFASFPLMGLLLPDLASLFIAPAKVISAEHLYTEGFLLLAIAICTVGIWYHQQQKRSSPNISRQVDHLKPSAS